MALTPPNQNPADVPAHHQPCSLETNVENVDRRQSCARDVDKASHTYCYLVFHHPLTLSFQA